MMVATLADAADAMQGQLSGTNATFRGVSTDTRTLAEDQLFFALRGPNFDGAEYVRDAASRSAAAAVVCEAVDSTLAQITVPDTLQALGDLAADWRRRMPATVIGLTGSNGKTTLKELIASVLAPTATTLATEGNLNNEIGVPLMLLRLSPQHVFAVIEMGANHAGEIARLRDRAAPQVVIITNAGSAHLEGFGSVEGVARAKGEILQGSPRPDTAVLNADDPYFDYWCSLASDVRILSFGTTEAADVRVLDVESSGGELQIALQLPGDRIELRLPLPGRHNALNAAAAAAASVALGIDSERIRAGLEAATPVGGRLRPLPGQYGMTVFDDSYNANPDSVVAAASFLASLGGQGWLVLGDMGELGDEADALHRQVGEKAANAGISRLFATGRLSRSAVDAFGDRGAWYPTVDDLIDALHMKLPAGDSVNLLVKGSRSMRMERVVSEFTRENGNGAGH